MAAFALIIAVEYDTQCTFSSQKQLPMERMCACLSSCAIKSCSAVTLQDV